MSFESFAGFSSAEPMSESAFEAFKEKMKAASAQIAALQKQQAKQKKQEDQLVKILLQFIQTSKNTELVLLISRCLEKNIPANFILAIVQLSYFEIQTALNSFLLPAGDILDENTNENALAFFGAQSTFPLKIRITLDNWLKNIIIQADEYPERLLKNIYHVTTTKIENQDSVFSKSSYHHEKSIQPALVALTSHVITEFLTQNDLNNSELASENFSQFILSGIAQKTEEKFKNRSLLQ